MSEKPFSNREIKSMFTRINEILKGHGDTHDEILAQVKITNGKVMKNTAWRWYTAGGLAVITTILLPLIFWSVSTISSMDSNVHNAVQEALTAYDINYE